MRIEVSQLCIECGHITESRDHFTNVVGHIVSQFASAILKSSQASACEIIVDFVMTETSDVS
jgi:hypothetical protein